MPTAALSTHSGTGHLPFHPLCSSSTRHSETNRAESRAHPISALDTQCSRVLKARGITARLFRGGHVQAFLGCPVGHPLRVPDLREAIPRVTPSAGQT